MREEKKKKSKTDYRKIEDKFFKQAIPGINRLLKKLGINHTIVKIIPNEFLSYANETKRMDLGGLIDEDGSPINIEFKSNYPSEDEIRNTLEYSFYLSSKEGKKVYSYIISTINDKNKSYPINWHNDDDYNIPVHTIKEFNAKETELKLQNKLSKGEPIDEDDLTDISILTFMDSPKSPIELIIDSIKLINQVNEENSEDITIDDINGVKSLLMLLSLKFTDTDEEYDEIIGMINMNGGLLQGTVEQLKRIGREEGKEEGILIGKEEGMIIERKEIANKLIKEGMPIKTIAKITKLSEKEIEKILS